MTRSPTVVVHEGAGVDPDGRFTAYYRGRPDAAPAHQPIWGRILRDGLGHRPYTVEARRGEQTVGLLPLALVKSMLFGRFLVSLPYLNYGGPVADDSEAEAALIAAAAGLADRLDVKYLELRNTRTIDHPALTEMRTSKVLMIRELPADAATLWKELKPEVRNQVRKGEKHELKAVWGGLNLLDDFYSVFSRNMRDLGTPVFGRRLFQAILAHLAEQAELCVVRLDGLPAAAALLLHGDGVTEVPSASSLREYNKTCANMFMYHQLLIRSVERGSARFDFGRSSEDGGTYRFKKQWGAAPFPSVWQYYVRKGSIGDVRPDNPKFRRKIELWKRLPLWLTRLAGPAVSRGIP